MGIKYPVRYDQSIYMILDASDNILAVVSADLVRKGEANEFGKHLTDLINEAHERRMERLERIGYRGLR